MLITPARILKIHEKVVPAVIHKEHNCTIPAVIFQDRFFILRDFLYRCKPILEYELELDTYSSFINFKFIYSDSDQYMVYKDNPANNINNDLACTFTVYVNRYALDRDFCMKQTYEYLQIVFEQFAGVMREIYQYINIYSYGYSISDFIELDWGFENTESLEEDKELFVNYVKNLMNESNLIDNLIRCVIVNNSYNNTPEFDIVHWIYFVSNASSILNDIISDLDMSMIISYQNWYATNNNLYEVKMDLCRDTCIIRFNCNIRVDNNFQSILEYTKNMFLSSIIDVANEILIDDSMCECHSIFASGINQTKDLLEMNFYNELQNLLEYYLTYNI